MKIALITDGLFPYVIGGMQKHSLMLAKSLAKLGVQIDLYHYLPNHFSSSENPFDENEKKNINLINIERPNYKYFPGHYLLSEYQYSKNILKEITKRSKTDFIYSQGFTAWALFKEKKKLPKIGINFHGYEMFQTPPDLKTKLHLQILKPPVKYCLRNADYVFSFGGKFNNLFEKLNIPTGKQVVLNNGISHNWLLEKEKPINIIRNFLFVGRYEKRKGIDLLNQALKKLILENIDFKFSFVGPIPIEKQINSDKIIYYGLLKDEAKIKDIYYNSDFFVSSSISEGMPTVILEAMAQKNAIIATDVGAVNRIIDNNCGFLIESNSSVSLYNSIKKAINISQSDLMIFQNNSYNKVKENFTWEIVAKKHYEFFKSIE